MEACSKSIQTRLSSYTLDSPRSIVGKVLAWIEWNHKSW